MQVSTSQHQSDEEKMVFGVSGERGKLRGYTTGLLIGMSRVRVPELRDKKNSRVNFLCWLLFRYPASHPRVIAVARKRSRSFCQRCRWQVTATWHAPYLRGIDWSGAWLYGVHRTCAETAAVSRGTSHATTKQRWTLLQWSKHIKGSKERCVLIRTKRDRRIFGVIPFIKLQNDT